MALSNQGRMRLGWFAAAVAPVVAVQTARMLFGGGPVEASAAVPVALPALVPPAPDAKVELTEAQRRALEWLAGDDPETALARSPMHRTEVIKAAPIVETPAGEPRMGLPTLRLGGIVTRGDGAIASINNRLFAQGDQPVQGWTIEKIDHAARTVTFRCMDGRAAILTRDGAQWLDE